MISFKLDCLLEKLNCSQTKFSKIAGVRPNTINDMCNGKTKRVEVETLTLIMIALNNLSHTPIEISDLIEFKEERVWKQK